MTFDTTVIPISGDMQGWMTDDAAFTTSQPFEVRSKNIRRTQFSAFKSINVPLASKSSDQFEYSQSVYTRFWMFVTVLCLSGLLSFFGLVSEVKNFAVVGAFLLALSGVLAVGWLGVAKSERDHKHNS